MGKTTAQLYQTIADNCARETVKHYLFLNGLKVPEKPALEWYSEETQQIERVTYKQLLDDIISLGTSLYLCGLKGQTITVIGERSYEWVLLFVTAMCSDVRIVPIDAKESAEEIAHKLRFCEASACFADEAVFSNLPQAEGENCAAVCHAMSEIPALTEAGRKAVDAGEQSWLNDVVSAQQPCVMMFTSGTGGKMKLAVLRQESFTLERTVWQGLGIAESQAKCLITLPLFHIAGLGDLRGSLMLGTTAYLSSGLKYLLKEYAYVKPEISFMVPAQAIFLYSVLMGKDPETGKQLLGGNLKAIRTSGAPLPQKIRELFQSYDIEVTSDYGMTETAGPVSVSIQKDGKIYTKPGSVGHILDCLHVYADQPDENGCGEIVVEGPCVFNGYYNDPEETSAILRQNRLYTGDIGFVDEEHFLHLIGRKKNIIILSNGENIIPEELEQKINRIPEVKECLVYAKDDKLAVKVYSDTCSDENYLTKKILELNKGCPNHKVIRLISVEKEPLPKTATGKILRGK